MQRLSIHRATVAGIGSTAALLAAVVAVSLILGGLVAYTASPDGPLVTDEPSLSLPDPGLGRGADALAGQTALVLPAPAPAPPAIGSVVTGGRGGSTASPSDATATAPVGATSVGTPAPAAAIPAPAPSRTPPATPSPLTGTGAIPPAVTGGLSDTTAATGRDAGGALNQAIGNIGAIVSGVSPQLGKIVTDADAGTAVIQTTDTVAGLIRRLGG